MSGVGLRAISADAKVNLASIAYHFGSKDGLLEALFAQRAAPIAEERLRLLAACYEKTKRPRLEDILDAFLRPALVLGVEPRFGGPAFVKLRARLATAPETLSRKILAKAFDLSSRKFIEAIAMALPDLPRAEVEAQFKVLLQSAFGKLDLVSRDEFDSQMVVLGRTRARLEAARHQKQVFRV